MLNTTHHTPPRSAPCDRPHQDSAYTLCTTRFASHKLPLHSILLHRLGGWAVCVAFFLFGTFGFGRDGSAQPPLPPRSTPSASTQPLPSGTPTTQRAIPPATSATSEASTTPTTQRAIPPEASTTPTTQRAIPPETSATSAISKSAGTPTTQRVIPPATSATSAISKSAGTPTTQQAITQSHTRRPPMISRLRLTPTHERPPLFDPRRPNALIEGQALYWIRTFSVLFILGAIVILIFVVLRWASARTGLPFQSGQVLQIHARVGLEPKKALWLVEVAQQYFLIASHEQGVTFLATLDPTQTQAALAKKPPATGAFWRILRRNPDQTKDAESPPASPIPTHFEVVSDGRKHPKHEP
ncbi:flagellar biosynthetic protein FliO [Myxococcota bacterium]|nr:flagellar biosynthetic protein FliO [Myxococcota bacterium]